MEIVEVEVQSKVNRYSRKKSLIKLEPSQSA